MLRSDSVSLGGARWIVQATESKAQQLSSRSNTAVVDVGGNQVAHVHMDGAQVGSADHCIKKGLLPTARCEAQRGISPAMPHPVGRFFYRPAGFIQHRVIIRWRNSFAAGGSARRSGRRQRWQRRT